MFILAIAYVSVQPYLLIGAYRKSDRIAIMDGRDGDHSFHISPVLGPEEIKDTFVYIANLATTAMLNRAPSTLDNEVLFNQIFLPGARLQVINYMKTDQPQFEAMRIHQKVEAGRFHILETSDKQIMVRSTGQIVRVGIKDGRNFLQALDFKIDFVFVRNPHLRRAGRLPYVVDRLALETRERSTQN
jgi:hypothetical protein